MRGRRHSHMVTGRGAPSLQCTGGGSPTQQANEGAFVVEHKPATADRTWTAGKHGAKSKPQR
jgi:hypothetical protein